MFLLMPCVHLVELECSIRGPSGYYQATLPISTTVVEGMGRDRDRMGWEAGQLYDFWAWSYRGTPSSIPL